MYCARKSCVPRYIIRSGARILRRGRCLCHEANILRLHRSGGIHFCDCCLVKALMPESEGGKPENRFHPPNWSNVFHRLSHLAGVLQYSVPALNGLALCCARAEKY